MFLDNMLIERWKRNILQRYPSPFGSFTARVGPGQRVNLDGGAVAIKVVVKLHV